MNARFAVAVLVAIALGPAHWRAEAQAQPGLQTPGDGLSARTAVLIGSPGQVAGVSSEYAWIAEHYPGSKPLSQALTAKDDAGKQYDIITIRTSTGTKLKLWFDITAMMQ